jgi:CheY-like chemotaxis protein
MQMHPKTRVLVVDDDESTLILICRMLKKLGYETTGAQDGKEALGCLTQDDEYQFVLTDINMPVMDGWELARRIKSRYPRLPIIALTGLSPDQILPRISSSGIEHALFKPLSMEHLGDILSTILESQTAHFARERSGESTGNDGLH